MRTLSRDRRTMFHAPVFANVDLQPARDVHGIQEFPDGLVFHHVVWWTKKHCLNCSMEESDTSHKTKAAHETQHATK